MLGKPRPLSGAPGLGKDAQRHGADHPAALNCSHLIQIANDGHVYVKRWSRVWKTTDRFQRYLWSAHSHGAKFKVSVG